MIRRTPLSAATCLTIALILPVMAHAAGSDLPTISTSNQGTANANAAEAADASVIFYNPAGMALLKGRQFSSSISLVALAGKVSNTGTTRSENIGAAPNTGPLMTNTSVPQPAVGPAGTFLPGLLAAGAFFASAPVNDTVTAGIGVFSTGGGITSYKQDWFGQYFGNKAQILTLNINPSLAVRLDEKNSIGLGVSGLVGNAVLQINVDQYQTGPYLLNAALDKYNLSIAGLTLPTGAAYQALPDSVKAALAQTAAHTLITPDSTGGAHVKSAWGFGYGWNVGYMHEFSDDTRVGISYRSRSDVKFAGDLHWQTENLKTIGNVSLPNPIVGGTPTLISGAELLSMFTRPDTTARTDFIIPAKTTLGFFHKVSNKVDFMADYVFTKSSVVKSLNIDLDNQTDAYGNTVQQGSFDNTINWRDSFSVAMGFNYHYDDRLILKTGIMYDQTPIAAPQYRIPLAPDNNRVLMSLGSSYKYDKDTTIDFAYSFLKIRDSGSSYKQSCAGTYFDTYYTSPNHSIGSATQCTGNAGTFNGKFYDMHGNILGIQVNRKF